MGNGKIIVIEGIDGSGKSTLSRNICNAINLQNNKGYFSKVIREPGGTEIGEKVRHFLLKDKIFNPTKLTESLLFFACRSQLIEEIIVPYLNNGYWLILDRFTLSTFAYQGAGRGTKEDILLTLNSLMPNIKIDLTIYLSMNLETSLIRQNQRLNKEIDKIENETLDFWNKVHAFYEKNAQIMKGNKDFLILNANLDEHSILKLSLQKINELFGINIYI